MTSQLIESEFLHSKWFVAGRGLGLCAWPRGPAFSVRARLSVLECSRSEEALIQEDSAPSLESLYNPSDYWTWSGCNSSALQILFS